MTDGFLFDIDEVIVENGERKLRNERTNVSAQQVTDHLKRRPAGFSARLVFERHPGDKFSMWDETEWLLEHKDDTP